MTMSRDEARILISDLIEWYTEDLGERLGLSMCKETYMDALETLWHGPEGELIRRSDAIEAVVAWTVEDRPTEEMPTDLVDRLKALPSADAVQGYTEWLEKIIVDSETFEWLCEDTTDKEWCEKNCKYDSIQAECLRHLYETSKGGDSE